MSPLVVVAGAPEEGREVGMQKLKTWEVLFLGGGTGVASKHRKNKGETHRVCISFHNQPQQLRQATCKHNHQGRVHHVPEPGLGLPQSK